MSESDIPKWEQANFVLQCETAELGIKAGLQDRVIQAYSGSVLSTLLPLSFCWGRGMRLLVTWDQVVSAISCVDLTLVLVPVWCI